MTNPNAAMRMLITYAIIIPVAIVLGWLLTNPLDYGSLGFLAFMVVVLVSPIFIKWHYPLLYFAIGLPAYCFFIPGNPPIVQVAAFVSLGIAILERILSSERRSLGVPMVVWPLLFILATVLVTAKLTGGISLHSAGGEGGGGRKYITVFAGIALFFALTSRPVPPERRNLYLALCFLTPVLGIISDLFPFLPKPLNYINLLFPPHGSPASAEDVDVGTTRLTSLGFSFGCLAMYILIRYGLRGMMDLRHPWRMFVFVVAFCLTLLGGYRNQFFGFILTMGLLFFVERLYRTRLLLVVVLGGVVGIVALAAFSNHLPYTFQRSMSFLPLKWDASVILDADNSTEWRHRLWRDTWPKVPEHLLLGKGYALSKDDFAMMGGGTFAGINASHIDASEEGLAISSDYHSGPLSTLMPFGIWGAIGILWLMGASLFVIYRNYRYGDPSLQCINNYFLIWGVGGVFAFFFIFGSFADDVGNFAKLAGLSLAFNGGLAKAPARAVVNPRIKPQSVPAPHPVGA